jgi:hypothetical protein
MTDNKETKYSLVTKDGREPVTAELTGRPFVYSSKALAQQGKRILENARKTILVIVPA